MRERERERGREREGGRDGEGDRKAKPTYVWRNDERTKTSRDEHTAQPTRIVPSPESHLGSLLTPRPLPPPPPHTCGRRAALAPVG